MPIHHTIPLRDLSQDEFDGLDRVVMQHAYAAQNELGRLFDERVYENQMARTLRGAGFSVQTQVPVKAVHGLFEKTYYLDLVVNQMLYELKAVAALAPEHEAQALHYAMLMDVRRAKLLNFRTERVQGKLCFSSVTDAERRRSRFETDAWRPQTNACERLMQQLRELVADLGTHLSTRLYSEALVHFNGGETGCLQRIPVAELGTHLIQSHAPGLAFILTSLTRGVPDYRHHLSRLIGHLDVRAMQWFNLNHATIECETLRVR